MLIFEILRNRKLAAKRSPFFEKNRFAKFLIYLGVAFWAAYLLFLGGMLPFAFREQFPSKEPHQILNQVLMVFLIFDSLIRFIWLTPNWEIRPFLLLPVSIRKVLSCLLVLEAFRWFNLFWLFLFVPFAFIAIYPLHGASGVVGYVTGIWLLMVLNGYWSLWMQVFNKERFSRILWFFLIYAGLALVEFCSETGWISLVSMIWGEGCISWHPLSFVTVIAGILLLIKVNFSTLQKQIKKEVSQTGVISRKSTFFIRLLERWGEVGSYMKLELKLLFRNRSMKIRLGNAMLMMTLFGMALGGQVYGEESYMNQFVCLYLYCIMGVSYFTRIMSAEGNYIDGMLVRKESIYNLLRAKYYVQCGFLLLPFMISLLSFYNNSSYLQMSLGYLLFSAGVIFPCLMQIAVFNCKTSLLNQGLTGKYQANSWYQTLLGIAAFTVPLLINKILTMVFSEVMAYRILMGLGIIGVTLHCWWIKNIYYRMMKRKYQNLEGFRNSR